MKPEEKPKKPYHRPQLVEYGSLQNLTQVNLPIGAPDNALMGTMTMSNPGKGMS
jgi:hypothetical protein